MKYYSRTLIVGILAAVFGACAFFILARDAMYKNEHTQLLNMTRILNVAGTLTHGTIQVVDASQRIITFAVKDHFDPRVESPTIITAKVSDVALIAHQELTGSNGVYDSLSARTLASLSDIHPGDRTAILVGGDNDQVLTAYVILFGNPL